MTMPSGSAGLEDSFAEWGLQDNISDLQGRTQEAVTAILQAKVDNLPVVGSDSEIAGVQDYFGSVTVGLGAIIEDVEELRDDVDALQGAEIPDSISEIQSDIEDIEDDIVQIQDDLTALTVRVEALEAAVFP